MIHIYEENRDAGITQLSKDEFKKHRSELGDIKEVQIRDSHNLTSTETLVVGTEATLHLSGFCVGYRGEGPAGLIWLLKEVGAEYTEEQIYGRQKIQNLTFKVQ